MDSLKKVLSGFFVSSAEKTKRIDLKSIRRSRYAYFLAYALELMLFKTRGYFMPIGTSFFFIPGYTAVLAVHGLASLIVMLLWTNRFKKLIYISAAVMAAGFVPFIFLPYGMPRLIFAMIAYAGLGGCVTAARCGYAFALNNAERLFGMLIMYFYCAVMFFVDSRDVTPFWIKAVVILVLLAAFCFCLLRFREDDFEVKETSSAQDEKGLYCALAFFISYFVIDSFNWGLVDASFKNEFTFLCIGMTLSGIFFAAAFIKLRISLMHLWNVFLCLNAVMTVFAILNQHPGFFRAQYFFSGLSLFGWPLSIYLLGCAQRQFASYRLLKKCTLIFVLISPVFNFSADFIEEYIPEYMPVSALIVVLIVLLITLIASHYTYVHLFSVPWIRNVKQSDMNSRELADDIFKEYDLTPRQREVAQLLLQAKTRRQIAGELGLSESTVKTHTSDLYKKLNINSRAELFRLFGVK